jgi:2-polyprenyl-3-methyl-5-hydroxy-6-metoxy-1,4-benzoquinol methylase
VDAGADPQRYHALHDGEQAERLAFLGTGGLRGRTVADIGSGAGSFLDLVRGLSGHTLAVEPARTFHDVLRASGHEVYSYAAEAVGAWGGRVDLAVSFSVIEHVPDPLQFLRDIHALLRPGGELVLSTPNLDDWLLALLPEDYGRFFFRTVHIWYFDSKALVRLAERAGFAPCQVSFHHRFDLANLLLWLRDRRPSGSGATAVPPGLDQAFRTALQETGRADYLFARFRRETGE